MNKAVIKTVPKGEIVFRQGDVDKVLYIVLTGSIGIYLEYGNPKEIRLSLLHKDNCFGEMSILEDRPRSATAVAEEDSALMVYPRQLMDTFVSQNPNFALQIMHNLSARLRNSTTELERIHKLLLEANQNGRDGWNDQELRDYIRLHTSYAADGTPQFQVSV